MSSKRSSNSGCTWIVGRALIGSLRCSRLRLEHLLRYLRALPTIRVHTNLMDARHCPFLNLYNNPSYSRILIGSCLWSIRGQTHDWRHHYKIFASVVLKWRKVLRIYITFYVTGQKIRYKKVLPRHWTGSRSRKKKDKAVSFRKRFRKKYSISLSRQSSETKPSTKLVLVSNICDLPLFCSYHILTSSVIYYWTDARQHGIYLLNK